MVKYTAVIPVHDIDTCAYRRKAFDFVIARMIACDQINEILVCSQGGTTVPKHSKVTVLERNSTGSEIEKSALANLGVVAASNQRVIINDADVWVNFPVVLQDLETGPFFISKPFKEILKLDEVRTNQFIEGKRFPANQVAAKVDALGGGALIIDKHVFTYLRGYDERITGWGLEDTEFGLRAHALFPIRSATVPAVHLYHPRAEVPELQKRVEKYAGIYRASRDTKDMYAHLANVHSSIPYQYSQSRIENAACIIAVYSGNFDAIRIEAYKRALREIVRTQKYLPHILVYEIGDTYKELCHELGIHHVEIAKKREYEYVFEKEALYNLAMAELDYEHLIFCDIDAMPTDPEWFRKIVDILKADPKAAVQPYGSFADTKAGKSALSYAYAIMKDPNANPEKFEGIYCQPGLVWAFNKSFLAPHGFNPMHLTGGGDTAIVIEFCNPGHYKFALTRRYFKQITRWNMPRANLYCVPSVVMHSFHGHYVTRSYNWSKEVLDCFGDLNQYVHLDEIGLVAWRDYHNPLRWMLSHKPEIQSEQDLERFLTECFRYMRRKKDL